jgi:hypothetical protein
MVGRQNLDFIRSQSMERWLVMLASELSVRSDPRALRNDACECQVVAFGGPLA